MNAQPVIGIFDIGKTNKKFFLFDEQYQVIRERTTRIAELMDEDGFPCEDLEQLKEFVFDSLREIQADKKFNLQAINLSTYGASLVYLGEDGKSLTPLYNYLKPYPEKLSRQFYREYGGEEMFSMQTASPVLGSLNAGMQLYRFKYRNAKKFAKLKRVLHLPQYLSYLLTGEYYSEMTSIGCHTGLWDFSRHKYHEWVTREKLNDFFPLIVEGDSTFPASLLPEKVRVGIGLHDSSAALIPYLTGFTSPFLLISTGTWSISLNPFNETPLELDELKKDCLCYIQSNGKPVKASRLHAGLEHERQLERIASFFGQRVEKYGSMEYVPGMASTLKINPHAGVAGSGLSAFSQRDLSDFKNDEEAYHQLMIDLVNAQSRSTELVLRNSPVLQIFVDGGFSSNKIYMHLLAAAFPGLEVYAASIPRASALGAALVMEKSWSSGTSPKNLVELNRYSSN
jgi:sugar (pentulose or hexulose) kinase